MCPDDQSSGAYRTNNVLKSNLHRVVEPPADRELSDDVVLTKERYSVPFFIQADRTIREVRGGARRRWGQVSPNLTCRVSVQADQCCREGILDSRPGFLRYDTARQTLSYVAKMLSGSCQVSRSHCYDQVRAGEPLHIT